MTTRRSFTRWCLALVALALAVVPASALESEVLTQRIDAAGQVRIDNLAGTVVLKPGSGSDIVATATVQAANADLLAAMEWREEGGTWILTYPVDEYRGFTYPSGRGWGGETSTRYRGERVKVETGRSGSRGMPVLFADLEIAVPAESRLRVENSVGSIQGAGLSGELELDTGSGRIDLSGFDGRLDVDTGSGEVEVSDLRGDLRADTGSGEIRISDFELGVLDADTGSGDIIAERGRARRVKADTGSGEIDLRDVELEDFEGDTGSGDITLRGDLSDARSIVADTGSGDVTVIGGSAFGFDLRADLGSGRVRVEYDDADLIRKDRKVVGATRGDRRTRIDVDTGSGDCVVRPGG